ncbi:hypothetical protein EVAR_80445_1 [Eumeta japonica]|uniref:Uncharacterized protein n=1 Tax=Eumeta variegata TaxID=151549 RepID=A0A4C1VHU7_EUMVA|nr:hypothetical protein EVAR_80445_1 [Eumeta japonica]
MSSLPKSVRTDGTSVSYISALRKHDSVIRQMAPFTWDTFVVRNREILSYRAHTSLSLFSSLPYCHICSRAISKGAFRCASVSSAFTRVVCSQMAYKQASRCSAVSPTVTYVRERCLKELFAVHQSRLLLLESCVRRWLINKPLAVQQSPLLSHMFASDF